MPACARIFCSRSSFAGGRRLFSLSLVFRFAFYCFVDRALGRAFAASLLWVSAATEANVFCFRRHHPRGRSSRPRTVSGSSGSGAFASSAQVVSSWGKSLFCLRWVRLGRRGLFRIFPATAVPLRSFDSSPVAAVPASKELPALSASGSSGAFSSSSGPPPSPPAS